MILEIISEWQKHEAAENMNISLGHSKLSSCGFTKTNKRYDVLNSW